MNDKEYTYLVSYVGRVNGDIINGHIEMTMPTKWSKGDTSTICELIQGEDDTPDNIAILSVFQL